MKEIEKLKSSYFAFRAMIFRRLRQVEGEHNQIKNAMQNIIERLESYEIELSKMPDPESTAVDVWLKRSDFDSSGEEEDTQT